MIRRAAVFGGAGFIGTNLVYRLLDEGCRVFNFDNLSGLGNLLNIAELMQLSTHSFARCDVTNPEEVRQSLLLAAPDTIFFCITPKKNDLDDFLKPYERFFQALSDWQESFSDRKLPVRKVVLLLSEHYKNTEKLSEFYPDLKQLIDRFVSLGLPLVSLLSPTAFGPFQQPDTPVSLDIYRAIEGETIPVLSAETARNELIHVKDIVTAALTVEEKGYVGVHYELEAVKPELTNLEVAEVVCETLNVILPPPVGRYQALIDEIGAYQFVPKRIRKDDTLLNALGAFPRTPIKEGLAETVKWYVRNERWYNQSKTRFFYLWQNPMEVLLPNE